MLSIVNVSSLAIGLASCILVFLFVQSELSFDSFNKNADQIYRVASSLKTSSGIQRMASVSAAVATALRSEYPGLQAVRIFETSQPLLVSAGDKRFYEPNIIYAENGFLQMFTYPLLEGDRSTALQSPNAVLLTKTTAEKYYGDEDPVGKTIILENNQSLKVTGVLKDFPGNSTIKNDFVISYLSLSHAQQTELEDWGYVSPLYTFILVENKNIASEIETNFPSFIRKYAGDRRAERTQLFLQSLKSIHLHSDLDNEIIQPGSIKTIYSFSIVGILVLLVACINFINISTARSSRRAKEVGVRKVLGANRGKLVRQFFSESLLYTTVSIGVALTIVELLLPSLNLLTDGNMKLNLLDNPQLVACLVGMFVFVTFVSGSYPALFISSFEPMHILKGNFRLNSSRSPLRKILVSVQFAVSILLISATIIVLKQMNYVHERSLGFDKKDVVVVPLEDDQMAQRREVFQSSLATSREIISVTGISSPLNSTYDDYTYHLQGTPETQTYHLHTIFADYKGLLTLHLELKEGRWFSEAFPSDSTEAYVVNEAALSRFGWKTGVGRRLSGAGIKDGVVIGVVKDFNYSSLHDNIKPLVIRYSKEGLPFVLVRIKSGEEANAISSIGRVWNDIYPDHPFQYSFLDETLNTMYSSDVNFQKAVLWFSVVAMVITCLGLLGLISYIVEQRRKEIAVRKVLGAPRSQIFSLLLGDFVLLILVALCVASPISYLAMTGWIENFSYHTTIGFVPFVVAGVVASAFTIITIGFQSVKATRTNPTKSLRYE